MHTHRCCYNLHLPWHEAKVFSSSSAGFTQYPKRQGLIQDQPVLEPLLQLEDLNQWRNIAQVLRDALDNYEAPIQPQPAMHFKLALQGCQQHGEQLLGMQLTAAPAINPNLQDSDAMYDNKMGYQIQVHATSVLLLMQSVLGASVLVSLLLKYALQIPHIIVLEILDLCT